MYNRNMKMRKEQILVYLPGKNTREYSFTSIGVAVYTFLAILLIVGLMAASAYVGLRFITPYYYSGHKMVKNKTVLKNVEEIRENLVYAEAYLDSMVELNNEIRLTAGLPNHSINSKDLAIGGYDVLKDPDDAENDIERLDANVRILSSKISYELENYKALYLDVRNYRKKLD